MAARPIFATCSGRTCTGPDRLTCKSTVSQVRRESIILPRSPSIPLTPVMHILGKTRRSHLPLEACSELCSATAPAGVTSMIRSSWTKPLLGFLNVSPNSLPPLVIVKLEDREKRRTVIRRSRSSSSCRSICEAVCSPLTCRIQSPMETSELEWEAFHFANAPLLRISETSMPDGPPAIPALAPNSSRADNSLRPCQSTSAGLFGPRCNATSTTAL
mmetsp:Transcript_70393/g.205888  ORF Transcript_70393/g.205888 Transcript_70393/m.205888 type:complete len:216 (+) Transcript_70393:314-961(+)